MGPGRDSVISGSAPTSPQLPSGATSKDSVARELDLLPAEATASAKSSATGGAGASGASGGAAGRSSTTTSSNKAGKLPPRGASKTGGSGAGTKK